MRRTVTMTLVLLLLGLTLPGCTWPTMTGATVDQDDPAYQLRELRREEDLRWVLRDVELAWGPAHQ